MDSEQLKALQSPLKEKYKVEPSSALITLRALRHKGNRLEASVRERRQEESEGTMKKTSSRRGSSRGEMRREYHFDYRKARPNRFAPLMKGKTVAVVLDPDIASVFRSSESVNSLLRSVITALPKQARAQLKSG